MEKVIFDIRKSLLNLVNLSKNKYKDNNTDLNKITYEVQNKIYVELLKVRTVEDMVKYSNDLISVAKQAYNIYLEIVSRHQQEKDETRKKEHLSNVEKQVQLINAYNEAITIINNHLNRYYSIKKNNNKLNNSEEIIDLMIKYMSLDPDSKEAQELNTIIYNKREERQVLIESLVSHRAGKYLFEIESLELRCARLKDVKDIDGKYNSEKFIKLFDENIKIINEFGFKKDIKEEDVSLYNQSLRNIKNLLLSLELDESFIDSFIMDVIRFNLNENYQEFEALNGLGFSKKNYNEKIDEINEKISSIKSSAIRKGSIVVTNKLETYDELINQINNIFNEIENEYSNLLGGASVYR